MIREATAQDGPALEAFLDTHADTSMFLRGNLAAHGIDNRTHRHGTTYLLHLAADRIIGVAGMTNGGYLMCQMPDATADVWSRVAVHFAGRCVQGMTGVPEQTIAFCAALGITDALLAVNDIQPLYAVALADVRPPLVAMRLRAPQPADAAFLAEWFTGYHADKGMKPAEGQTAQGLAQDFIHKEDSRIGVVAGQPVAMTAINARAAQTVQVGGVYVPDAQRGQGYGGAVVAAQLTALVPQAVQRAILFAASPVAARAYERIGFRHIGAYRIALLQAPFAIGTAQKERTP